MKCRHCKSDLSLPFLNLGYAPPSNAYLTEGDLRKPEITYPLRVLTCTNCWLVQTEDYSEADELFSDRYAYFSSTSKSWLAHASEYCDMITRKLALGPNSFVVEIASNDGYLLKNFVASGVPCLGIEPTKSTADAAKQIGVPVREEFFGAKLGRAMAEEGSHADLVIGNNVLAHVPNINDFVEGVAYLLAAEGVVTFEFPHLQCLIAETQFDTVYHEHFSYLSLQTVVEVFQTSGLRVFDVEKLGTHGGSLRVYGCLQSAGRETELSVERTLNAEAAAGLQKVETYEQFQSRADAVKDGLVEFLIQAKRDGHSVAGYGAAAKGNTLMNYAGIKPDLLPFVCDAAASKIGKFLPGSHIPILEPSALVDNRPDFLLILPWNIAPEIMQANAHLARQGTKFVTAVPEIRIT